MGLFSKDEKYKVVMKGGKAIVVPVNADAMVARYKEQKKTSSLDAAAKEFKRKERNKRVDRRRARLKKIAKTVGGGLKKTSNYLGSTQLAKQGREKNKNSSGRYRFEDKNDWF